MKNLKIVIILVLVIIGLSISFIMYVVSHPTSNNDIQMQTNSNVFVDNNSLDLLGSWSPINNVIGISWQEIQGATGYKLEKQMDGGEWVTIADNYNNTQYNDNKVLSNHTYQYRLFLISKEGDSLLINSNLIITTPRSQKSYPHIDIQTPLEQVSPVMTNVPFYELHVNETQSKATPVYFNCDRSGGDCRVMVNRKLDTGGEYLFGYKNGTEVFAIMERYNGTVAFVQRVNPETSAYTMQINPSGQIIMWYPLYLLSGNNHWGRIEPFNNGTVKFVLEDPPFPTCVKC